jgi:hypothetical protein
MLLITLFSIFFQNLAVTSVQAESLCNAEMTKGSHCVLDLRELRPTQPEVGYYQIFEKAEDFKKLSTFELDNLARKKEIPCIIGPDRKFYLIDHHHQSLAFLLNGFQKGYVQIVENWKDISPNQFWMKMCGQDWCYRRRSDGSELSPDDVRFPKQLSECKDSPYRSLVWLLMKKDLVEEASLPYFEFKVGEVLYRHGLRISGSPTKKSEWEPYLEASKTLLKQDSVRQEIRNLSTYEIF